MMDYETYNQVPSGNPRPDPFLQPHRGTLILIFGILGLTTCGIFGILAWIWAADDLRKMDEGRMDPSGQGLTKAGKVMGIITVILHVVGILIPIAMLMFSAGSLASLGEFL